MNKKESYIAVGSFLLDVIDEIENLDCLRACIDKFIGIYGKRKDSEAHLLLVERLIKIKNLIDGYESETNDLSLDFYKNKCTKIIMY